MIVDTGADSDRSPLAPAEAPHGPEAQPRRHHRQARIPSARLPYRRRNVRTFQFFAVAPGFGLVFSILAIPIVATLYFSFTDWDGQSAHWVGLANYSSLAANTVMRQVLANSFIFLLSVPVSLLASLLCAILIHQRVRGWAFFRLAFFVPSVLSPVVVGELFAAMFAQDGVANWPLRLLGLPPVPWLASPWLARLVIIAAVVWAGFGFGTVVLLAAMSGIDPAIDEAARLDGAGWWRRLWSMTVPLVAETLQFLAVINVIFTFTSLFGFVFVITGGGPGFSTTTIDLYTFLTTFQNGNFGYGAALAGVLFCIVLGLSVLQFVIFRKQETQQGA